ncbi:MAG TPA: butyrate kinase [Bacillota bacterium]|nr:butyrate kinase [Bacillota bacterium]HPA55109.1 butyrate kinase [Bacillota bacterium]
MIISEVEQMKKVILDTVKESGTDLSEIDVIVGRGGNMKPVQGGVYEINEAMVEDLRLGVMGQHASNLGGIIAYFIAAELGIHSYVVDPVVVDELEEYARISGIPDIERKSKDHPLNQKAAARMAAKELGGNYTDYNFVVAHLGGGISVGAHKKGRMVDVNNTLDGDGPFSPERSGGIAHDTEFVSWIKERMAFIAPVKVYPGENEMKALVQGVSRVLKGEEQLKSYN